MKAGTVFRRIENFIAPKKQHLHFAFLREKAFTRWRQKKSLRVQRF